MGNELTVYMQYGQNSFNEIEHTDKSQEKEDLGKLKVKLCEELPKFDFDRGQQNSLTEIEPRFSNKQLLWISNPTPPPEFVG